MTQAFIPRLQRLLKTIVFKGRLSRLKWHDLRNVQPVSRHFGFDRGTPIDRYYIDKFLQTNRQLIKGRSLEVAESLYTKRFGENITDIEVLHVEKTRQATIVGDLTASETLPSDAIDCFICTQVYNCIFDFQKAIAGTHHLLRPGGVALVTVSGISPISRYDADRWGYFWNFCPQGILQAMQKVFGEGNVQLTCYGNSLAAIAFLKGLAAEELSEEELNYLDQDYPVSICLVATKAAPPQH